ncbi:MAG: phosphatase PAP2 family protein [Flavobacteriaceae bacterium]|nr:phosphatase PAP2 family protein [Flavobacteriaceae bacterium]
MRQQILTFLILLKKILKDKFDQYNHKLPYFISILLALIIVVAGIKIFLELTESLQSKFLSQYDSKITDFIISFRSPELNKILQFITNIGDIYGYLAVGLISSIAFYLKFKNWRFVIQMIFVLGISALSNLALKQTINRPRPDVEHLVSVATLSYPSGHAMSAISFYGFLIYLCYGFKMNKWIKLGMILFFTLLIFSIGISRIYLGVHFPSDIAGGFIAGLIWVAFCVITFNIIDLFRRKEEG